MRKRTAGGTGRDLQRQKQTWRFLHAAWSPSGDSTDCGKGWNGSYCSGFPEPVSKAWEIIVVSLKSGQQKKTSRRSLVSAHKSFVGSYRQARIEVSYKKKERKIVN